LTKNKKQKEHFPALVREKLHIVLFFVIILTKNKKQKEHFPALAREKLHIVLFFVIFWVDFHDHETQKEHLPALVREKLHIVLCFVETQNTKRAFSGSGSRKTAHCFVFRDFLGRFS